MNIQAHGQPLIERLQPGLLLQLDLEFWCTLNVTQTNRFILVTDIRVKAFYQPIFKPIPQLFVFVVFDLVAYHYAYSFFFFKFIHELYIKISKHLFVIVLTMMLWVMFGHFDFNFSGAEAYLRISTCLNLFYFSTNLYKLRRSIHNRLLCVGSGYNQCSVLAIV